MIDELADLHDRVVRDVSAVPWPESKELRRRARRRRTRRVLAVSVVVVLTAFAAVWTTNPALIGVDRTIADGRPPGRGPAAGLLRGNDVGPNHHVPAWGYTEPGDQIVQWPFELTGCPAYDAGRPDSHQRHAGGFSARAQPSGSASGPIVEEEVLRFGAPAAAGQVLAEARDVVGACATYTVRDRVRYTASVTAAGFAGDDAVQVRLSEEAYDKDTGQALAPAAVQTLALVRVGSVVILVAPWTPVDSAWLQNLANTAVSRLCQRSDEC